VKPLGFAGCGLSSFCWARGLAMNGGSVMTQFSADFDEPVELFVFATARSQPMSSGSYQLGVVFGGESCDFPSIMQVIQENTRLRFETFAGQVPNLTLTGSPCANPMGGADRVFRLRLPIDGGVTATVRSEVPVTLNLLPGTSAGCAGGVCLAGANSMALADGGQVATMQVGPGPAPREGYLVVSARGATRSTASYDLSIDYSAPGRLGDTCGRAEPLTIPTMRSAETLDMMSRDYSLPTSGSRCRPYAGAERVYSIEVPVEKTVVVEVASAADSVLNVVPQPAWNCDFNCTAGTDVNDAGVERIVLENQTRRAQRYFVVVSRQTAGPMTYGLSVTSN
jgi:hypothetical protein